MAKDLLDRGTAADDGTGDQLRPGAAKINANFDELYARASSFRFISATTPTDQPASPSDEDTYIIPPAATGADWAGNDGKVAIYSSDQAAWEILTPLEGMLGRVVDTNDLVIYDGAAWAEMVAVPSGGATGQILKKQSATDYDVDWAADETGSGLPVGGADGQVLTKQSGTDFDADWETPSGGSVFSGARVYAASDFSQSSGANDVTGFDTEDFDDGGWWDSGNPEYFTVPSGVTRISATLYITDAASVTGQMIPQIKHYNSSGTELGKITQQDIDSTGGDSASVTTGAFSVVAGDRILASCFLDNARTLDGTKYGCSFAIHAL